MGSGIGNVKERKDRDFEKKLGWEGEGVSCTCN